MESNFLSFSSEQLKDLAAYLKSKELNDSQSKKVWSLYYNGLPDCDFLKIINYDIYKLQKLYSFNLKRFRSESDNKRYLKLSGTPRSHEIDYCLKVFRILQMPLDILPLKMNKFTGVSKTVIFWRFLKGI